MKQARRFTVQRGWKRLMHDLGLNPARVLALVQLPSDLFERSNASLSPAAHERLWHALEQATGMEALPLALGQAMSVEAFDPQTFASLCCPNLNIALQRLARFKPRIGPLTLTVHVLPLRTLVTLEGSGHDIAIPASLAAAEFVFLTRLARLATRQNVVPLDVELAQVPQNLAPYDFFFGTPVRKTGVNRITFEARDAARVFQPADPQMGSLLGPPLQKRPTAPDTHASIRERVRAALLQMLPAGQSDIGEVASRLGLSKRSLQRQLGQQGSRFQDVLNQTRRELAEHYLSHADITVAEVSWLLGFADVNSFTRAFRGWTGTTPGAWRAFRGSAGAAPQR